jgi:hypothetical protein
MTYLRESESALGENLISACTGQVNSHLVIALTLRHPHCALCWKTFSSAEYVMIDVY